MTIITAAHLSKWYGQVSGLNDVTVTIPRGITGLLGPNGAGKSTFMKLVTGQLRPSTGTFACLTSRSGKTYRVSVLVSPDQDGFYERTTGLEWVTALARLHGMTPEAPTRRPPLLEAVDLMMLPIEIGAYSKGMRQSRKLPRRSHDPEPRS